MALPRRDLHIPWSSSCIIPIVCFPDIENVLISNKVSSIKGPKTSADSPSLMFPILSESAVSALLAPFLAELASSREFFVSGEGSPPLSKRPFLVNTQVSNQLDRSGVTLLGAIVRSEP